ncbi:MAG: hypothetical protein RBU37_00990 [Myxococcota bacterium]|jgi:hypothetical protein|nr:hypothetical protein [Myxococcota bacterium]
MELLDNPVLDVKSEASQLSRGRFESAHDCRCIYPIELLRSAYAAHRAFLVFNDEKAMTKEYDDVTIREGEESVRRTVVGGRPSPAQQRRLRVAVGIEKVLYLAASNPEFLKQLEQDRSNALASLALSDSERTTLSAIPTAQLNAMIGRIDVKAHAKRDFMRAVATVALAAATSTAAVACKGETPTPNNANSQPSVEQKADIVELEAPPMPPPAGIPPHFQQPQLNEDVSIEDQSIEEESVEVEAPPPATKGHRIDIDAPPPASRGISSDRPR